MLLSHVGGQIAIAQRRMGTEEALDANPRVRVLVLFEALGCRKRLAAYFTYMLLLAVRQLDVPAEAIVNDFPGTNVALGRLLRPLR